MDKVGNTANTRNLSHLGGPIDQCFHKVSKFH